MHKKQRMENGSFCDTTLRQRPQTRDHHLPMAFKISKDQRLSKKETGHIDAAADTATSSLFEKRFEIEGDFELPEVTSMFTESAWSIEALQFLKKELNETKAKLNDYNLDEWSYHTNQRNKAGEIQRRLKRDVQPEFLTQAWCKFYENASSFPLVDRESLKNGKLRSIHLCEAPGAFVTSLNHWLKTNAPEVTWTWLGTTLNPHYEGNSLTSMVNVDHLILNTPENWFFGTDNTGNLMNLKNLDALVARANEKQSFDENVTLVTADGSINCLDTPAEQEEVVSHLHYCEAVAALEILAKNGNFLLKIFTIFEHQTICLVYLLSCCFERIIVNKPVTSKDGNSEVYLVCLGYAGNYFAASHIRMLRQNYEIPPKNAMFRRCDIPDSFVRQIINCGEFFKAHQCEVILANIRTFRGTFDGYSVDADTRKIRKMVADRFMDVYNLRPLNSAKFEIVGKDKLATFNSAPIFVRTSPISYNSRRERENLKPLERLAIVVDDLKDVTFESNAQILQMNDDPEELLITTGKPYVQIESSRFCTTTILKMYSSALRLAREMQFSGQIPSPEIVKEYERENSSIYKIENFEYTSLPDSHKLIRKFLEGVKKMEKNENLVFLGYSLLSQLNVGLLYLLAHCFKSLEFEMSEKLGCIIILRENIGMEKIEKMCELIGKASDDAKLKGEAVLSIIPIATLCNSKMYQHIVGVNHWIIKYCVCQIAASFEP